MRRDHLLALLRDPGHLAHPKDAAVQREVPMSKSLARVKAALRDAGIASDVLEMASDTRTARQAAAAGCALDQIAKSILFQGESGRLYLFLTAGGNQVDGAKATALVGEPLGRADADTVRAVTGFAIGGVAPLGHLTPSPVHMDPRLMDFATIWAAAGTPRHIFPCAPSDLHRACGATLAPFTT
jgi:prolyl-tRNA editing enzyme YbaK/EbsC (Cys-tRNA(Pro) deacylase)